MHLHQHDSAPYHAALLPACLYNPVYDRQIEGSRAEYLFGLISLTPQPAVFAQRMLDAFATLADDDALDAEQLCDFALNSTRARAIARPVACCTSSSPHTRATAITTAQRS